MRHRTREGCGRNLDHCHGTRGTSINRQPRQRRHVQQQSWTITRPPPIPSSPLSVPPISPSINRRAMSKSGDAISVLHLQRPHSTRARGLGTRGKIGELCWGTCSGVSPGRERETGGGGEPYRLASSRPPDPYTFTSRAVTWRPWALLGNDDTARQIACAAAMSAVSDERSV